MAYTDFFYTSDGEISTPYKGEKKHWDIAISCYEPFELVTGGIGTYTRMLLELISKDPALKEKKIALFCRKVGVGVKLESKSLPNFKVFEIQHDWDIYGKRCVSIGSDHDWFSWNLAHYLLDMTKKGHSFGFFEFPDYAVEGYFPLKMRRAGLIDIQSVGVRLHSPELMLFRDNLLPARAYDPNRLTRISRELFCYQHCDQVLYGAPAMLSRIAQECRRFGVEIESRAVHVEHPYPVHDTLETRGDLPKRSSIHIGYIGRMEVRKGILSFLRNISQNEDLLNIINNLDIVFELFGADCTDQNEDSVRSQIMALHRIPELRGRIISHGYMSQNDLGEKVKYLDGFIFPSLFENYPNALLEVLHTDSPILVSESGGMPYISRDLPGIYTFSYGSKFTRKVTEFFCSLKRVPARKSLYFSMATNINSSISAAYAKLSNVDVKKAKTDLIKSNLVPSVDFVIPFYNDGQYILDSLKSAKMAMTSKDCLYIIDDCSQVGEFNKLEMAVEEVFGKNDARVHIRKMTVNSGPSAVRNVGARMGHNEFIQFLDADDCLNHTGYLATKYYLSNNAEVDFTYGVVDNFGSQNHIWVPRDSSVMTCLDENYTHSAILIKRTAFNGSGGFDDEMRLHFEDWQFNCKLALSGYRGEVIPFVSLHYRVRDGSRTFLNLEREALSREQVIERSCMKRRPQESMLQGELLELIGKYSSLIHGRWNGESHHEASQEPLVTQMNLSDLCNLEGEAFIRTVYGVILGRAADEAGLKFYLRKLEQGINKSNIIADLMISPEVKINNRTIPREFYRKLRVKLFVRRPIIKRFLHRRSN